MIDLTRMRVWAAAGAKAGAAALTLAALAGCASTGGSGGPAAAPPELATAAPLPPPPQPPPVDLAGRWKLAVAGAGGCAVTLGDSAGASEGSVAPAGGCPGKFFTGRKWTYEHDRLIIRNHKGEVLVELSFADGRFQGHDPSGAAVTLSH